MPDIRDRVEQDRGLLKKIQLVIPGYAGYRRREDIRAADNLLRIQLANQLKGVRGELEDIRDGLAMEGKIQGLQGIGNIIFTVEGLEAKVRHAEGGYSGISATIQIKETELDKLYEYDYAMLDSLDKAAAVVPMIQDAADPKSFDASLKACRGRRRVRDRVEEPHDGGHGHPGEVNTMIPISFFFGGARRTDQTAGRKEGLVGAMTVAWDDQFKRQNIMWKVPATSG